MTESSAGYPCRDGVSWEELLNLGKTRGGGGGPAARMENGK